MRRGERPMKITIQLKPGHPTGTYHRAGFTFASGTPTVIELETLTPTQSDALAKDPWLAIDPVDSKTEGP
jgi:hypothetical protein